MRIPLGVSIESRDGTVDQDAKVVNGIVEVKGEQSVVRKRPGNSDVGLVKAGVAQALISWNGLWTIQDDNLNSGTFATIVTSGRTSTNLSPTAADLQFDAQETSSDAATSLLMIKNRVQGWTVNRAGTASAITFGGDMGSFTYAVTSITRSGTVATVTTADDTGLDVGESVTIGGADQADYNGAQTVTAVTLGSFTAARAIPITITRSSTTATATSTAAHGLTTATAYTIAGANQSEYNGSKTITVTGATTFTYTVSVTAGDAVTWNPADKNADIALSNGNLTATSTLPSDTYQMVRSTEGKSSGKWYWEVTAGDAPMVVGVANSSAALNNYMGSSAHSWGYAWSATKRHNAVITSYGATYTTGDVIGIAMNMDNGTITFYKNGVSQGEAFANLTGTLFAAVQFYSDESATANFGGSAFAHSVPSGYSALQGDSPQTPATGSITVTDPAVTVAPTFTYTVANSPVTPATGTITAAVTGGMVPGIAYINGYFCVMDVNGVVWSSDSDDPTTWNALNFVTALNENGRGVAIAKSGAYLIALKEWSTEFFYDREDAQTGSPFSPVQNGFTQVGCAHGRSVASVDGNLMWLSQSRQQGRGVYVMSGLQQQKVSTPDVERILNADDLATVHAYGLKIDGHSLYVLTLVSSDITLVFDLESKVWGQWTSLTAGSSKSVSSITRVGNTATVTTSTAHTLNDGDPVKIASATQTEYNGVHQARYVSSTVFTIEVDGDPTTPATGTITALPYTESYFKFTKYVNHGGLNLLLHESDGHLYQIVSTLHQDAGIPINLFARTTRLDGGSTNRKKMPLVRVICDTVPASATPSDNQALVRWSDDDCSTFTAYRVADLSEVEPELRRCGSFKRRTMEVRYVGNKPLQLHGLELEIQ